MNIKNMIRVSIVGLLLLISHAHAKHWVLNKSEYKADYWDVRHPDNKEDQYVRLAGRNNIYHLKVTGEHDKISKIRDIEKSVTVHNGKLYRLVINERNEACIIVYDVLDTTSLRVNNENWRVAKQIKKVNISRLSTMFENDIGSPVQIHEPPYGGYLIQTNKYNVVVYKSGSIYYAGSNDLMRFDGRGHVTTIEKENGSDGFSLIREDQGVKIFKDNVGRHYADVDSQFILLPDTGYVRTIDKVRTNSSLVTLYYIQGDSKSSCKIDSKMLGFKKERVCKENAIILAQMNKTKDIDIIAYFVSKNYGINHYYPSGRDEWNKQNYEEKHNVIYEPGNYFYRKSDIW